MKRRQFLGSAIATGAGLAIARQVGASPFRALTRQGERSAAIAAEALQLHPFIAAHPDAVFIRRTNVATKLDTAAKLSTGAAFAAELFTPAATGELPFTHALTIKPNLTCTMGMGNSAEGMGIITDLAFLEGVVQSIRDLGFPGHNMFMREGNWMGDGLCAGEYPVTGILLDQMAQRYGGHVFDFPSGRRLNEMTLATLQSGTEVIWRDVPDGMVFRRIGYIAPYNDDDSFLLNIAKFKAHSMGMTLASKNLQGTAVPPYIHFCEGLESTAGHPAAVLADFQPDREQRLNESYSRHLAAGVPRWDRPGGSADGGFGMETWAQRTCDSLSVTPTGLNIIEGIYGRNGNGFNGGPGPGDTPEDFMSNILIFGKNPLLVDVIGCWIAGHEPGNFGLFHVALERGLCPTIIPDEIPLYDWNAGEPAPIALAEQTRTPIVCPYLRRDYNGQNEEKYHLVNEPFDYSTVSVRRIEAPAVRPEIVALRNPVRHSALFELRFPAETAAKLEVYDAVGRRVDLLRDARFAPGSHSVRWTPGRLPAGMYIARLSSPAGSAAARIMLLR